MYRKIINSMMYINLIIILLITSLDKGSCQINNSKKEILGMYIHMHWAFNHPYAARTWTIEDWKGYVDGLSKMGYNTIMIWPIIETMPVPLTHSDKAHLEKLESVIKLIKKEYKMNVYIVVTANVTANNDEAIKYSFENRPFYHTDRFVNPRDSIALSAMINIRTQLFTKYLTEADGIVVGDSDPGGWPLATNDDFLNILSLHRKLLDDVRPEMDLYVWTHQGWTTAGRMLAGMLGGEKEFSAIKDLKELLVLISKGKFEPWSILGSRYENDIAEIASSVGMEDKVITVKYGSVEREPSFPFTNYGDKIAYNGGKDKGMRGTFANAQQHCVQLPNTFAFARGAQGLSISREDYISFANDLIPGEGELIVDGWEALQGNDEYLMSSLAERLTSLLVMNLEGGTLKGLLFNDPDRFVRDLILQLKARSSINNFIGTINREKKGSEEITISLSNLILHFEAWQKFHGYASNPRSTRIPGLMEELLESLKILDYKPLTKAIEYSKLKNVEGSTPMKKVINRHKYIETLTPTLIYYMKDALINFK